jgi:hypothetical protein
LDASGNPDLRGPAEPRPRPAPHNGYHLTERALRRGPYSTGTRTWAPRGSEAGGGCAGYRREGRRRRLAGRQLGLAWAAPALEQARLGLPGNQKACPRSVRPTQLSAARPAASAPRIPGCPGPAAGSAVSAFQIFLEPAVPRVAVARVLTEAAEAGPGAGSGSENRRARPGGRARRRRPRNCRLAAANRSGETERRCGRPVPLPPRFRDACRPQVS